MSGVSSSSVPVNRPNPQGKGCNDTLGFLSEASGSINLPAVGEDSLVKIINDCLGSLFVLSCEFKFKPVPGNSYCIYSHHDRLILSLVEPEQGGSKIFEHFVGKCRLRTDLTWELGQLRDVDLNIVLDSATAGSDSLATKVQSVLNHILEIEHWKYERKAGYYQNGLRYLMLKSLWFRCQRMRNEGCQLSVEEKRLLEPFG